MLQGGIIHKDPKGHKGTIQAGDVQWMTAGRGIIHSEFPEEEVNNGLQLWINLPSTEKMYKINL
jgi:redox-sensitive bicupin YhaK (pirin superfamily)